MAPGQDQDPRRDHRVYGSDSKKAALDLELRRIVSAGTNLDRVVGSLTALRSLNNVLAASGVRFNKDYKREVNELIEAGTISSEAELEESSRTWVNVWTLQNALRRAILRIPHCGDTDDRNLRFLYAEVLALLFGTTSRTRGMGKKHRWEAARGHYNSHAPKYIAGHKGDTGEENFRRKIYENELLPCLVEALLDWEQNPGKSRAEEEFGNDLTEPAANSLYWRWRNEFVWLFRFDGYLSPLAHFMKDFFDEQAALRRKGAHLPASKIVSGRRHEARHAFLCSAQIWRFIRGETLDFLTVEHMPVIAKEFKSIHKHLELSLTCFKQIFTYPENDPDWLYQDFVAIDSDLMGPLHSMDEARLFRLNLIWDKRFLAFERFCSCSMPDQPSKSCLCHVLIGAAEDFHSAIDSAWIKIGRGLAMYPYSYSGSRLD